MKRYSIRITNPEGFSLVLPNMFRFKRRAEAEAIKRTKRHAGYTYEIIDNKGKKK